jgi:hypothetical protein
MKIYNTQKNFFNDDVVIYGSLSALSGTTFTNTTFTTTSALSVVNTGVGPALYVAQAAGNYDIASFYDLDGVEVLHVGNAPTPGSTGKIGINESNPGAELTVRGAISGSGSITAADITATGVTVKGAISGSDGITVATATVRGSVSATGRVNTLGITQNIIPVVAGLSALNLTGNNGLSALVYTPPTGYRFITGDYFITPTVKIGNYGTGQSGGSFTLIDSDYQILANSVSPTTNLNIDNVVKGTLSNTTRSTTISGVWIVMSTAPNLGTGNTVTALSATVLVTGYLIPTTSSF